MKKRIGRPSKEPTKKQRRASLTFRVLAEVKLHLIQAAKKSGRSLAHEAEALIEKGARLRQHARGDALNDTRNAGAVCEELPSSEGLHTDPRLGHSGMETGD